MKKTLALLMVSLLGIFSGLSHSIYPIFPLVDLSGTDIKLHLGSSGSVQFGFTHDEFGNSGEYYNGWIDWSGLVGSSGFDHYTMTETNDVGVCGSREFSHDWLIHVTTNSVIGVVWADWFGGSGAYDPFVDLSPVFGSLISAGGTEFWLDVDFTGSPQLRSGAMPSDYDVFLEDGSTNPTPRRSGVYSELCDTDAVIEWSASPAQKNRGKKLGHR